MEGAICILTSLCVKSVNNRVSVFELEKAVMLYKFLLPVLKYAFAFGGLTIKSVSVLARHERRHLYPVTLFVNNSCFGVPRKWRMWFGYLFARLAGTGVVGWRGNVINDWNRDSSTTRTSVVSSRSYSVRPSVERLSSFIQLWVNRFVIGTFSQLQLLVSATLRRRLTLMLIANVILILSTFRVVLAILYKRR